MYGQSYVCLQLLESGHADIHKKTFLVIQTKSLLFLMSATHHLHVLIPSLSGLLGRLLCLHGLNAGFIDGAFGRCSHESTYRELKMSGVQSDVLFWNVPKKELPHPCWTKCS